MSRSMVALLGALVLAAVNVSPAHAQTPNFKDIQDRINEFPDKLKEIPGNNQKAPRYDKAPPGQFSSTHKIDINSASVDELKTLPGMSDGNAQKIIAGRPYRGTGELAWRNIVPRDVYDRIAIYIVARPPGSADTTTAQTTTRGGDEPRRPASQPSGGWARAKGGGSQTGSAEPEVGGADYAAMRKAADAVAMGMHKGLKLWRVDLNGYSRDGALKLVDAKFYYFLTRTTPLPNGAAWVSSKDVDLAQVNVKNAPGMHLPQASRTDNPEFMVDGWQLVPVPSSVRAPEALLAGLNRALGRDPGQGLLRVRLLHVGDELGTLPRYRGRMLGDLSNLGLRGFENEIFIATAPHGPSTWLWWTVVEQQRADPAANPRGPGTPTRVREFIYVDAMTGAATSRCTGATPKAVQC